MKKSFAFLLALLLAACALAGCSDTGNTPQRPLTAPPPTPVSTAVQPAPKEPEIVQSGPPSTAPPPADIPVDVDLTVLSSTMIYAEVSRMVTNPDAYVGKTIRARGLYYASHYEEMDLYYHFVVIPDATACCVQGLEFVWSGEHTYPVDYPADDTEIEVTGLFDTYKQFGNTYYYIAIDALVLV